MSISKINPEDISLLNKIFNLSKELIIYDPEGKLADSNLNVVRDITSLLKHGNAYEVCVNLSEKKLEVFSFKFILEFSNSNRKYKSFYSTEFLTVNNPDKSIRWLLPASAKHPDFLALYNGSGIKAGVLNFAARIAFKLNIKKWICQGSFFIYSKEENYFQNRFAHKDVAIFTGTVGENRKAVAALCEDGSATHFIKIPVSENAETLIKTEDRHLKRLNEFDFEKMILPTSDLNEVGLKLNNICPKEPLSSVIINEVHLDALKDLYANTFQVKELASLDVFEKVKKDLVEIKNTKETHNGNLSSRKVERLSYNLKLLLNTFDELKPTSVAYAHGDFTPWNMFVSKERIHSYDWELAMPEQLFLYDAFHFVFQSSILVLHQPFDLIKKKIERLKSDPVVVDLIERYRLDFWDCYRWYLISNCSYYLNLYLKQESLHKQAFWLVDCWINATNDAIKQNKSKLVQFAY